VEVLKDVDVRANPLKLGLSPADFSRRFARRGERLWKMR
jgi:hypothetical protein